MDAENSEAISVADEQAGTGGQEDHRIDTLEAAMEALGDDEEQSEEQPADEGDEPEAEESEDEADILLPGGDKITLAELKNGYLRSKDYTHKTTEVANDRKALEGQKSAVAERAKVIETVVQNLSAYLQGLIPEEPSLQIAQTNPNEYVRQVALRNNAMAEISRVLEIRQAVDAHQSAAMEAEARAERATQEAALLKAMPGLTDPAKKAVFDANVKSTAQSFGFTDDEIGQTVDHRILRLVHYAQIGLKAEENRKNASRRVETPKDAKPAKTVAPVNVENRKAMHRLSKTGSFRDAMSIDF